MTATTRKYNPGFLSDNDLVATFCVRTDTFASMIESLRECTGNSNTHQIVIGPRGSGKTSLLLRVAAEIRRDGGLSSHLFPIVFAEESYEVSTAGEFWLECLSRLVDQAPSREQGPDLRRTLDELRHVQDDRMLGDRCLGVLQDFSDREGKRLVMIVENLNMMFGDIADENASWQLRQTLQTEPRLILLASATSRFEEIDNPKRALYDLFRVLTLCPLGSEDCAALWQTVSGRHRPPETIKALRILTGGSPRLLTIVARFGGKLSFRQLMADLLDLVDDHTEYFKSHLDTLPAQERRVYLALANLWMPATAREIADRARLDTSKCSAQLARLIERGAVEVAGGSARRKLYYLTERLYNIYYLMRRSHGPVPLIQALIHFMEAYYSPPELRDFGIRITREATDLDDEIVLVHRIAFDHLLESPSMAVYRDELRSLAPWRAREVVPVDRQYHPEGPGVAKPLFDQAFGLANNGQVSDALAAWDEIIQSLERSNVPADLESVATALVNKGTALGHLKRTDEALATWDEVVRRFGSSDTPAPLGAAVRALIKKAAMLGELNRRTEALAVCDELFHHLEANDAPTLFAEVATALVLKGLILGDLNRSEEALRAWDEVVQRFGASDAPDVLDQVATALLNKGNLLGDLKCLDEALAAWDEVVKRFGPDGTPKAPEVVAIALANKGSAFAQLNRPEDALAAWNEIVRRFGASDSPAILEVIAISLVKKGDVLVQLNRPQEALQTWDEIMQRFGTNDTPMIHDSVDMALFNKGTMLSQMNRQEDGNEVWDEIARRFGSSNTPVAQEIVATSLVNKGIALANLNQLGDALDVLDEVVRRFRSSDESTLQEAVSKALLGKGKVLAILNQLEQAVAIYDEVLKHNRGSSASGPLEAVAWALVNKGDVFVDLKRPEEALATWDEAVQRFETSDVPMLCYAVETALLRKAEVSLAGGRAEAAIAAVNHALERKSTGLPGTGWQAHLIRARAHLAQRNIAACTRDIEAMLAIFPRLGPLPKEVIDGLCGLAVDLGLAQMRDLIKASSASDLLLPLTTALEKELGLEPRVAKEVEEVAEDIQRDMAERRNGKQS